MYDYIKIPEIIDAVKFENLTLDLYNPILERIQKNGRSGQCQDGVDIYGYNESNELIGIQCKVKSKFDLGSKNFTSKFLKEIHGEVEKAKNFSSKLKLFIIMTTAPRDSRIQKEIIDLDEKTFQKDGFHIKINFWDDITHMLTEEIHKNTFKKYYNNLIIQEKIVGDVQAKLLNLVVGVEPNDNSLYELILGYIPKLTEYPNGIAYYSNSYFLGCLQSKTIDTFPLKCFPSDLENVIKFSNRDRYTITDWINSIDIDEELKKDTREYRFHWTKEEFNEYLARFS